MSSHTADLLAAAAEAVGALSFSAVGLRLRGAHMNAAAAQAKADRLRAAIEAYLAAEAAPDVTPQPIPTGEAQDSDFGAFQEALRA